MRSVSHIEFGDFTEVPEGQYEVKITKLELTEIFQSINYYKLRGYTYPYQDNSVPGSPLQQNLKS